jgi:hypothetical protein
MGFEFQSIAALFMVCTASRPDSKIYTTEGVCQLPQSPGVSPANCRDELERCFKELGSSAHDRLIERRRGHPD